MTIDGHSPEFQYSCGRHSQIWRVSPLAMKTRASQRIEHLSRHKTAPPDYLEHRAQFEYSCGRSSEIWTTSKAAMSCRPRPHTASLARPKQTHQDYRPSRQVTVTAHGHSIDVLEDKSAPLSNLHLFFFSLFFFFNY